ncbi:hypothetical protein MKW92_007928 [Papaver armeniacum]|nr:hypothetical protein MKW92_007928 [Papaver armeniacum]
MGDDKKKKIAVFTVSSVMLVAMVVAVTFGVTNHLKNTHPSDEGNHAPPADAHTSNKAIEAICQPTQYKQACVDNLGKAAGNTTDPKELIKIGFNVTLDHIREALSHSGTLLALEKEPNAKLALQNCQELMDYAIDDLVNSFDQLGNLDLSKIDDAVEDLKVWLAAALTKAGQSMRDALNATQELTNNGLDMVSQISKIIGSLQIPLFNRRLMSEEEELEIPPWATSGQRRLLKVDVNTIKPNAVVAQDGSGQFRTVKDALQTVPVKGKEPFVIHVKAGVYKEYVNLTKSMTNITNNRNVMETGMNTFASATFSVVGYGFMAKDIGFENTAGAANHQAVALRVSGDMSILYNVQIDGYQDTLYAHAKRQFYRDCTISGTVDFVFGNAVALFQNCKFIVRKPMENQANMVLASGRKTENDPGALILQDCTIQADPALFPVRKTLKSYLGRPWKAYARHVIMHTEIGDLIDPQGWHEWMGNFGINTCYFVEFENTGPGATGTVGAEQLKEFTATSAIMKGGQFITSSGIPFKAGL